MPIHQKKKIAGMLSVLILVVFTAAVAYFIGRPMLQFAGEPEQFRAWVDSQGVFGSLAFIGMMVLQIVVAIIPGEPLEFGAGYAFGFWYGSFLCLLSIAIGSALVFLLVRKFGMMLIECFFSRRQVESFQFLHQSPKRDALVFFVMLFPGTPKDLLSYLAGLTDMPLWKWVLIATVARIPSVLSSAAGGSFVGEKNYTFAVVLYLMTVAISGLCYLYYRKHFLPRKKP